MYNKQFNIKYTHNNNNIINTNFIIEYFTNKNIINVEYVNTNQNKLKRFTTAKKTFTTEEKEVLILIKNDIKIN